MRYAVPLHDIGKIGLSLSLLHKPGRLTPEELETTKTHTLIGHRILLGSPWPALRCAAEIALSHHENWAGGGYPHGWVGEGIPRAARIAAVADVFDCQIFFNPHHTRAMVYATQWCGVLSAQGAWIVLELQDGQWRQLRWTTSSWVS